MPCEGYNCLHRIRRKKKQFPQFSDYLFQATIFQSQQASHKSGTKEQR